MWSWINLERARGFPESRFCVTQIRKPRRIERRISSSPSDICIKTQTLARLKASGGRRPPTHSQPPRRALATEEELLQAARASAQGREKWCSFPGLSQNLELRCGIIFGIWLCHLLSPVSSEVACSTRPIHDKDFALKKEF